MALPSEARIIEDTIIFPAAIDPDAAKIVTRLKRYGHEAYLVGGCVRDLLLGAIPKDFDVSTSARPRQIRRLFRNSKIIGRRFKLAHIMFRDKAIEVSTFRKLPPPEDSKHFKSEGLLIVRDNVYGEPRDDALRRDFTVNSLFYDLGKEAVIDYSNGFDDLNKRLLRTIGDPHVRYCEDPIRILRAIRFSCRLKLWIEPENAAAMKAHVAELQKSAPPRVKEEIIRLLACGASRQALHMIFDLGLLGVILPELESSLEKRASWFNTECTGKEFLVAIGAAIDDLDRGRRRYSDALFLTALLSHHVGVALSEALSSGVVMHDRIAFIDGVLRPIAMRMGVSKKELNRIKHIVNGFHRFERKKWRGRPRPMEFVRRDYFRETLEFYRFVVEGFGRDKAAFRRWLNLWNEQGAPNGQRLSNKKKPGRSRGGRRRRPRRRSTPEG